MTDDPIFKLSVSFKCRLCNDTAEGEIVDETLSWIRCAKCGIKVEGERASEMYRQELRYLAIEKARVEIERDITKAGFSFKPGDENVKPDWEFYVESNEK